MHTPLLICILDGWGHRDDKKHNAIATASTPNWDRYWTEYPHTLIQSAGVAVGLPIGQMGNSEVGHMHLGAGRILPQDYTRINQAIESGEFSKNPKLNKIFDNIPEDTTLHLMGLLSPGGVHSHETHLFKLLEAAHAKNIKSVCVHAFLDGRDTPPRSAESSIQTLEALCARLGQSSIASITGRYYAMDRDSRWERIQKAYDCLTTGQSTYHARSASEALRLAYNRDENDEFVSPTWIDNGIDNKNTHPIEDNDTVLFFNFRADRARQLSIALTDPNFPNFDRKIFPKLKQFITMTRYSDKLSAQVLFEPNVPHNTLGEYLSNNHLKQLRIAETEKYAHVTFFLNGGREEPFENESRILIPSPKIATYDLQPEMSAPIVADNMVNAILAKEHDVIIANFANADMVGHTGNFKATSEAIECIDSCLGKLEAALKKVGGELIITADHGNAEYMFNEKTGQAHTAHTNLTIPFVYIGRSAKINPIKGSLIDIAPSALHLLNLPIPPEMTGQSLLDLN